MAAMKLYEAVRSSASFRVRIALNLKGLPYEPVVLDLRNGAHRATAYARVNPAQAVPALVDGSHTLAQSMAILEYLDETYPRPPLLPGAPLERARVRAISQLISCDIHPLDNLRVLFFLERELRVEEPDRDRWYHHWIHEGFGALEQILGEPDTGAFCQGDAPTMADCCLVPQVVNAVRFKVDLGNYPRIVRIHEACMKIGAFAKAHPDRQ
jgi:maleylacetoacetate isomerase